jgi:hypothetical protein
LRADLRRRPADPAPRVALKATFQQTSSR